MSEVLEYVSLYFPKIKAEKSGVSSEGRNRLPLCSNGYADPLETTTGFSGAVSALLPVPGYPQNGTMYELELFSVIQDARSILD